jgi:hypothetical protein
MSVFLHLEHLSLNGIKFMTTDKSNKFQKFHNHHYWLFLSIPHTAFSVPAMTTNPKSVLYCFTINGCVRSLSQGCRPHSHQGHCPGCTTRIYFAPPTPTACCAASTKPWTETILDDVPHYPVGQSVSDTGRPGQKWWKTDFSLLYYYFCDYSLSLGLLCLFWLFFLM